MNIDEAIKILSDDIDNSSPTLKQECKDARKLGLNGLKAIKAFRSIWGVNILYRLSGETLPSDSP